MRGEIVNMSLGMLTDLTPHKSFPKPAGTPLPGDGGYQLLLNPIYTNHILKVALYHLRYP